jgi:hypothetical protein
MIERLQQVTHGYDGTPNRLGEGYALELKGLR